jgi:hypothetical protein
MLIVSDAIAIDMRDPSGIQPSAENGERSCAPQHGKYRVLPGDLDTAQYMTNLLNDGRRN